MVCLSNQLLIKGRRFEESYETPKPISRLSNKDIEIYLATYGRVNDDERFDYQIPILFASPIKKPGQGLEFKSGYTGDIRFFGIPIKEKYSIPSLLNMGAHFENRKIEVDTYFNNVLYEAYQRGIVQIRDSDPFGLFFSDLFNLRMKSWSERDSIQKRNLEKHFLSLKQAEEYAREHPVLINA